MNTRKGSFMHIYIKHLRIGNTKLRRKLKKGDLSERD